MNIIRPCHPHDQLSNTLSMSRGMQTAGDETREMHDATRQ